MNKINDANIDEYERLISPNELRELIPINSVAKETVISSRDLIEKILLKEDKRKIIILGPCSIHDIKSALEYAHFVRELQERVKDKFLLVMRVYFEKPRSTIGWKGLIYDPNLDSSNDINLGLKIARQLLLDIVSLGVPVATEFLGMLVPQYISDLVSWAAIGARTTESQTHRELVSGLSMPVGFKNSTNGSIDIAINAMLSSSSPHSFVGIDNDGNVSKVYTKGNKFGHLILRGGSKPNYESESVTSASNSLSLKGLIPSIIIDCSHGNSNKDFRKQASVFNNVIAQIKDGNSNIIGLMIESNLNEGSQKLGGDFNSLDYGVSITDACISKEETENLILSAYDIL